MASKTGSSGNHGGRHSRPHPAPERSRYDARDDPPSDLVEPADQVKLAQHSSWISDSDLVAEVSQREPWQRWQESLPEELTSSISSSAIRGRYRGLRIVCIDLGIKRNQLRALVSGVRR